MSVSTAVLEATHNITSQRHVLLFSMRENLRGCFQHFREEPNSDRKFIFNPYICGESWISGYLMPLGADLIFASQDGLFAAHVTADYSNVPNKSVMENNNHTILRYHAS